jgi:hypothetical protein
VPPPSTKASVPSAKAARAVKLLDAVFDPGRGIVERLGGLPPGAAWWGLAPGPLVPDQGARGYSSRRSSLAEERSESCKDAISI